MRSPASVYNTSVLPESGKGIATENTETTVKIVDSVPFVGNLLPLWFTATSIILSKQCALCDGYFQSARVLRRYGAVTGSRVKASRRTTASPPNSWPRGAAPALAGAVATPADSPRPVPPHRDADYSSATKASTCRSSRVISPRRPSMVAQSSLRPAISSSWQTLPSESAPTMRAEDFNLWA